MGSNAAHSPRTSGPLWAVAAVAVIPLFFRVPAAQSGSLPAAVPWVTGLGGEGQGVGAEST